MPIPRLASAGALARSNGAAVFSSITVNGTSALNGAVTITAATPQLVLQGTATAMFTRLLNVAASGKYSWQYGAGTTSNQFDLTPSTATDGTTFSNPLIRVLATGTVTLGNTNLAAPVYAPNYMEIGPNASTTSGANVILSVRSDQNGLTRVIVRNANTGASALTRFTINAADDFDFTATSSGNGSTAAITSGASLSGGLTITAGGGGLTLAATGANTLTLKTNAVSAYQITSGGILKNLISGNESTGAGSAALGANSPAVTNTAPYTWIKLNSSDGSTVYVPVWK